MAKNFYYKDTLISKNKMYGYLNKEVSVYKIEKDGRAVLIDREDYQTGTTPGPKHLAFQMLVRHGYLPKKYEGKDFFESEAYKKYNIWELL